MLTRKQLPSFGKLRDLKFDISEIQKHCHDHGLFNFEKYTDIQVSSKSAMSAFVQSNHFSKNQFFLESEAAPLEGESYKQLYLTKYKGTIDQTKNGGGNSIFSRARRLNRTHKSYDAFADELNYGEPTEHVQGILLKILSSFKSQVTRVRLAYLAPHFAIKPHVDYDPSYIARFHIPIQTNELCTMHVKEKNQEQNCHFSADGSVYFLNAGKIHWAKNDSSVPRLHLIVDTHGQLDLENNLVQI